MTARDDKPEWELAVAWVWVSALAVAWERARAVAQGEVYIAVVEPGPASVAGPAAE